MADKLFWEAKSLEQMSDEEWELLCDGCGRCCLQKLQDEDSDEVFFTRVSCSLLNTHSCRCTDYQNRFKLVPDCLAVRPLTAEKITWLPQSCAYRLLTEGKPLRRWHPLISGTRDSVKRAGISMAGQCVPEQQVPLVHYDQHLIEFEDSET